MASRDGLTRRGTCAACKRQIALRKDDTVWGHGSSGWWDQWCPGSGNPPAEPAPTSEPTPPPFVLTRRIGRQVVEVMATGEGQSSIVHVTGLPALDQNDARWLLNALSHVTLMPPRR